LPEDQTSDAATLIGVLHHLPGHDAKTSLLRAVALRLKPNAPFILACNRGAYAGRPLFLNAWATRWRLSEVPDGEIEAKIGKILQGADPPASDKVVATMLALAGFKAPELFFSSLFWGAWIARVNAQVWRPIRLGVEAMKVVHPELTGESGGCWYHLPTSAAPDERVAEIECLRCRRLSRPAIRYERARSGELVHIDGKKLAASTVREASSMQT
jgi:hypothetical protein